MKTFLFILTIILGFTTMFMWFLLSESTRINDDIKSDSWELTQDKTQLDQLIKGLNAEIRGLKQSNLNWQTISTNSCGSENMIFKMDRAFIYNMMSCLFKFFNFNNAITPGFPMSNFTSAVFNQNVFVINGM